MCLPCVFCVCVVGMCVASGGCESHYSSSLALSHSFFTPVTHAHRTHPQTLTPQHSPPSPKKTKPGFGRHYFRQCPQLFASDDAAYILAYAIIMLNTDLHNNQVGRSGAIWGRGVIWAGAIWGGKGLVLSKSNSEANPCAVPPIHVTQTSKQP